MIRIGLASDSQGNVDALALALDIFARAGAERVFFLGGCSADVDAALARRRSAGPDPLAGRITRVASRACPEAALGAPTMTVDMLDGHVCLLVHDKADLGRDDIANAALLFHGKSDAAALVQIGPRAFVTPGHLRARAGADRPATFAFLELEGTELELVVFSAEGAELRRARGSLAPGARVSVR
ncbi:MAG TPA: hypothetical protein VEB43_01990 [Anaeromyxobacter sp.]|nr:hypothetical protein [Anaeromyxobacter sp.]